MTVLDTIEGALHAHDSEIPLWLQRLQALLDDPANQRYRKALQVVRGYLQEVALPLRQAGKAPAAALDAAARDDIQ